ncbi:spherulin 4-like cell surface [Lentinula edodes]|uniref:Spherulin 4-like cell surface n=1 Tax=Lentinula edodes TaxID=5353 RepID=A0A1Q3EI53_LENED|nr:spherulin 4-like cell surface [Lentinula edodes]
MFSPDLETIKLKLSMSKIALYVNLPTLPSSYLLSVLRQYEDIHHSLSRYIFEWVVPTSELTTFEWGLPSSIRRTSTKLHCLGIYNPDNLAHSQPPADYQACISLVDAGAKQNTLHLLGYVDTANGQRNSVDVLVDIETYAGWDEGYRPEGVYFDNSPTGAAYLVLFNEYGNYVRELFGETGMVALNPSAVPDSGYFTLSDLIVTVNEDYNIFNFSNLPLSPSTPVEKQIVILYNAPNNLDFSETVVDEISAIANIKACFITPSSKDTEYTSVPDSLFQLLGSLIASQTA